MAYVMNGYKKCSCAVDVVQYFKKKHTEELLKLQVINSFRPEDEVITINSNTISRKINSLVFPFMGKRSISK